MNAILAATHASHSSWLNPSIPTQFPNQIDLLGWCQNMDPATAVLLLLFGGVYLLFGWYLFKGVVMLNATLLGAYLGAVIGAKAGSLAAGAIVGALIAGGITWPLMKWAVAVLGGLVGAAMGASIWMGAGLEHSFAWAGAMTGLVGFGMLSFILFRGSIIMYTSLQGSLMLILGLLGLLFKYQSITPRLVESMSLKPFILPMAVLIAAACGLVYQQRSTAEAAGDGGGKEE